MFRSVLLPVDLTDRHAAALGAAADVVAAGGGVTLLHVIEPIPGAPADDDQEFFDRLRESAQAHLGRLAERLQARGIAVRADIRFGSRGPTIVETARETGSDLIVLTAPQYDPAATVPGGGSLSYAVMFFAHCPVLLVKRPAS
jgi:nucleotide-binding universal stress UspA family protein